MTDIFANFHRQDQIKKLALVQDHRYSEESQHKSCPVVNCSNWQTKIPELCYVLIGFR